MPETASPDRELSIADPTTPGAEAKPETEVSGARGKDGDAILHAKEEEEGADKSRNGHFDATEQTTPKTNGHALEAVNGNANHRDPDDERPAKRQRTRDATPPNSAKKLKPESPPWKRMDADGPTSFTENGRRKSGRINTIPLEMHPPGTKRMTRRAVAVSPPKKQDVTPNGRPHRLSNGTHKPSPASKPTHARSASNSTPKSAKRPAETRPPSRSSRRRTPSPPPPPVRHSTRPLRASRFPDTKSAQHASNENVKKSPRITLRVGRSGYIPLVHADQVRKRPKIGTSFEDFWERAAGIAVEEGGLQASEDGPLFTDEMALRDARLIMRIEQEAEPGGILSAERCSIYASKAAEDPPPQYSRQDHLLKAMTNFRKLMVAEQQRHRSAAKKLAEACRDEWMRRQPKSAEQLEAEQRDYWIARYRVVAKTMFGTWENVRAQVNRRRLEEWEAEEQRRVKAALNEAVNISEQKLQARRAGLDSEMLSDEDGFGDLSDDISLDDDERSDLGSMDGDDESNGEEDSDNMSSSEDEEADEAKDVADEGLTQEQLQAKYANIPDLEPEDDATPNVDDMKVEDTIGTGDSSDESVDMDDDLGSSSMDSDGEDEDAESESGDESGGEAGGLLGLLFGKSELKQIKAEADVEPANEAVSKAGDVEVAGPALQPDSRSLEVDDEGLVDDDEVSLVQHPDSVDGDGSVKPNGLTNGVSTPALSAASPSTDLAVPKASHISSSEITPGAEPEDTPMTNDQPAKLEDQTQDELAQTTKATSPDTDPASEPQSPEGSQAPTPETKPSEVDESSVGHGAIVGVGKSGSSTPLPTSTHKTEIPFLLRGTLREYQHDGLDWLAGLYANNTNGILADEMGLGKTIQTIALLAHLACNHSVWGPHLVVVPTSVMLNWEMEFKKWCPGFKILAYYGSQEERKRKRQGWNNDNVWNVCITSYQLVLQDQQVFKRRRWHYMILDEAHNIKNFKSQRWQTLLGFNTHSRLLLTGTPLQNNLTELWSLLFFLMPAENGVGGFADLHEFHDWFHKPESQILESGREQMDDEARAIISKLHKVLRPYLLRRLKADVEKQMPAKYEHVEFCRLSKRQRELYDGFLSRTETKETLAGGNYLSIINCLMQLRKVCNHPDLFVDRPIMTSFRMQESVATNYEVMEQTLRKTLLAEQQMSKVSLSFLNLIPTQHEHISSVKAERIAQLSSHRALMDLREAQKSRAQGAFTNLDPSTVGSTIAYLESAARWGRFEELQHCVYLNALRRQQRPIYGKNLIDLVAVGADQRPSKPRPKLPQKIMKWFEDDSNFLRAMTPSIDQRADSYKTIIEKFACVTPAVVTPSLEQCLLGRNTVDAFTDEDLKLSAPVRWAPFLPKEAPQDPWHEARMRLSIQFPDKRLLQYDCGKLQALDKLLRKLQAGGHRALIFTQMTKVLDILEQFLNIHGHKYLRLDGATKVEQRQILTDRFNNDPRILCFILSTRSGGLGINLTGADTVIFYDQDWNPAMDKQCQDRCHRIGQTRDVHIYRLVSEHTIEANILRKASQKQMLDDVVIQEGEFTTDHFKKLSVRDVLSERIDTTSEGVSAADAALDRVLGGPNSNSDRRVGRVFEQAEDREDVAAARVAEKEIQADDEDFTEKPSNTASGASTTRQGTPLTKSVLEGGLDEDTVQLETEEELNAWGERMSNVDDYMLRMMTELLRFTKLELPKDKKRSKKKGKDTRKR